MVIMKLNAGTNNERDIEIVSEKGLWRSGIYHLFKAQPNPPDRESAEPVDKNDPDFIGEINVNKEKANWEYRGKDLSPEEQKELATFIIDYQAPDGVY